MRKSVRFVALGLLLCLSPLAAVETRPSNHYLIELRGAVPAGLADAVAAAGGTLVSVQPDLGYASAKSDAAGFAGNLAKHQGIQAVTQDIEVRFVSAGAGEAFAADATEATPNPAAAAFFRCQWPLKQANVPAAWAKGQFGDGIKVAVLDSGVDPFHQDLAGKIDTANSTSTLTGSSCGAFDLNTFYDLNFHGSFVSAIVTSNNLAVAGVAPNAQIVGVKVLNCEGFGSFTGIIRGIYYAANLPDVDVINMSLGAFFPKSAHGAGPLVAALNKAVNYANAQGKLVVTAAGNDGMDMQHTGNLVWVPAESGGNVTVYATNNLDGLTSYSNYGPSGTLIGAGGGDFPNTAAPIAGCPINNALESLAVSVCSSFVCGAPNFYLVGSGTSFSAPLVAGIAALVDGKHNGALNPAQLKAILKNSADDIGQPGTDLLFSHGRANAGNAVDR